MTPTLAFLLAFFGLGGTILAAWWAVTRRISKRALDQRYPRRRLTPEVIRVVGACGVTGCPNSRPHSHVQDLVRRMKGK